MVSACSHSDGSPSSRPPSTGDRVAVHLSPTRTHADTNVTPASDDTRTTVSSIGSRLSDDTPRHSVLHRSSPDAERSLNERPRIHRCSSRSMSMWDYVNSYQLLETYQLPKNGTFWLIEQLVRELRGFQLNVITARCPSRSGHSVDTHVFGRLILEHLTRLLGDNLTANHDYDTATATSNWEIIGPVSSLHEAYRFTLRVVFTCTNRWGGKSRLIHKFACNRMFGDSDEDISSCLLADEECVPLRVQRSPNSSFLVSSYHPNLYHELIVDQTYD